jgi:hypothetical protein
METVVASLLGMVFDRSGHNPIKFNVANTHSGLVDIPFFFCRYRHFGRLDDAP